MRLTRPRIIGLLAGTALIAAELWWVLAPGQPAANRPYMLATANPYASEAGAEILKAGGSAVDAAIAVQAVLTLVEPESSGLGGGGFMLHWSSAGKALDAYDGRETAPKDVTPDIFLDATGAPRNFIDAMISGRSVGTPGAVAMLALAHKEHGKLAWDTLFEPAIRLAEDGFKVSPKLAGWIKRDTYLASMPQTRDYFLILNEKGERIPVAAGAMLKNPKLAASLRLIAEKGPEGFYRGALAQEIVQSVASAPNLPGNLSLEDLASYEPKKREPLCGPYRSYRVCTMPPPTSGGVTTLQILGILEEFDMGEIEPMSLMAVHFIAEAEKLSYADRDIYVGDPDHVRVPLKAMLDPHYIRGRARLIDPSRSMGVAEAGALKDKQSQDWGADVSAPRPSTTHFTIVDSEGNVVSMTGSVEGPFGSHLMAGGMILNNQLTDFSFLPEQDGQPVANAVAPGKRPRSSMDPVIVFDNQGAFYAALGSPGGERIIGYVTQTLVALIDWRMDLPSAFALPRFVDQNGPLEIEAGTSIVDLTPQLQQLGHDVKALPLTSGLHGIRVTPKGLEGAADPRREGNVVSGAL
jgi:gamma-glutamyltranspeptidase/glutathione hydrolase